VGIFKRGRFWSYEFVFRGQRYRKSTRVGDKEIARQIETSDRNALIKGEHGIVTPTRIPTFRTFAETFIAGVETDAERPRTIGMYRTAVAGLVAFPRLAKARLDQIDVGMIDAWKQWKVRQVSSHKKPFSPETINLQLRALRAMLGKAKELGHIRDVPKVRRIGERRERDFVLREDKAYLDAAAPDYRVMALVMLDGGLRIGEVLSLEWPEVRIHGESGKIVIPKAKAKGKKEREVPLTPRLVDAFKARGMQKSGYVFHQNGEPLPYSVPRRAHEAARIAAGLPPKFTIHCLRHTFGTLLGDAGIDGFVIMKLMGHQNIKDTERYVHPGADALERAIGRMVEWSESPQSSHYGKPNRRNKRA
jgi:integrase/recombinase XerD